MQKIKAYVGNKLHVEQRVQQLKGLPRNTLFQSTVAAIISAALLSWLEIRPLGLLFLIILSFWFYKTRLNVCIQTPPELRKHLQQMEHRLVEMRQQRPTLFCAVACSALGILAVVGHLLTGSMVVLVGLVVAAIVSTKYNFKILHIEPSQSAAWSENLMTEVDADDEFLPEVNESNMNVLERAGDLASLTSATEDTENEEDKSDEVPSELLIPDSIPEIDENSTDEEQDELLPVVKKSKSETHSKVVMPLTASSLVKYSQSEDAIEFKKGHFKRDSSLSTTSSSSEESLSKGLKFPDHTTVDAASPRTQQGSTEAADLVSLAVKAQTQALLSNSSRLLPSLVSGLMQNVLGSSGAVANAAPNVRKVTALDSSDESDFEMLDNEDFQ